jgi:hypothetical protein
VVAVGVKELENEPESDALKELLLLLSPPGKEMLMDDEAETLEAETLEGSLLGSLLGSLMELGNTELELGGSLIDPD